MTNTDPFLPEGYEMPQEGGKYLKLKPGKTKIRILSGSKIGWIDWKDKQSIKTVEKQEALNADPKKAPKQFWAFIIWSYSEKSLMMYELTQSTIKNSLMSLYKNEDRGDPKEYDITIERVGSNVDDTKYTVTPSPKKELSKDILEALNSVEINMDEIFNNGTVITEKKPF